MHKKQQIGSLTLLLVIAVSILSGICTSVTTTALVPFFWGRSLTNQILIIILFSLSWAAVIFMLISRFFLPRLLSSSIKYRANWLVIFLGSIFLFLKPISTSIISQSRVAITERIGFTNEFSKLIWFRSLGFSNAICISIIFFMVSILLIPGILIKNKNGERIFQNIPLFLILTVNYFNIVGNFNYRLAIWTEDVGTILVPYYFKNPTFYANDLWMRISWRTDLASLPTMITTFLYLVFNFKPEIPTFFLFYIQLVLIYFAVFRLALVMTKKREIAWLSTFFAFSATPWDWNIAALVPPMTAVYSQNLALPLIIFAASYFLENRFGLSMVLLGVAGLIHPTLTIGMIAILGLYLLWRS